MADTTIQLTLPKFLALVVQNGIPRKPRKRAEKFKSRRQWKRDCEMFARYIGVPIRDVRRKYPLRLWRA